MTTLENANKRRGGIPDDAPQEKLEWVTPKISLMATTETERGKILPSADENETLGPS
jgi:hypothetical protein